MPRHDTRPSHVKRLIRRDKAKRHHNAKFRAMALRNGTYGKKEH